MLSSEILEVIAQTITSPDSLLNLLLLIISAGLLLELVKSVKGNGTKIMSLCFSNWPILHHLFHYPKPF